MRYFVLIVFYILCFPCNIYALHSADLAYALKTCSNIDILIGNVNYSLHFQDDKKDICIYKEKFNSVKETQCSLDFESRYELSEIFNLISNPNIEYGISVISRLEEFKKRKCGIIHKISENLTVYIEENKKDAMNMRRGLFKLSRNHALMRRLKISLISLGFGN